MICAYEGVELRAIAFKVIIEPEDEAFEKRIVHVVSRGEEAFRMGRVLSIGQEAAHKLPDLQVGDRVLYAQSTACTTAVKDRHIVHHDHVICAIAEGAGVEARAVAPMGGTEVTAKRKAV